jgi:hypothetical protein
MALITTIQEVKQVLSISNMDLDDAIPDMATTQEVRLTPYLGDDFSNELQDAYNKLTKPLEEGETSPEVSDKLKKLIPYVQRVLAPFAYADNLGSVQAKLTSAGVRRFTSENMPSVYRWEYEELKQVLLSKAYASLETLLKFLQKNANDYPTWENGIGLKMRQSLLIKNGADFSDYFKLHQPYQTYHMLISCMRDVDELYIIPLLGSTFYNSIKILTSPSELEAELIHKLKFAIANLTISQAAEKLPVRIDANGFTVMNSHGDSASNQQMSASEVVIGTLKQKTLIDGRKYIAGIRQFLNKHASSDVFKLYFESDKYTAPDKKLFDRGNEGKKIFRM